MEKEGLPLAGSFWKSWRSGDSCRVEELKKGRGKWWDWLKDVWRLTRYIEKCHECEEFETTLNRFWGEGDEDRMRLLADAVIALPWRMILSVDAKLMLALAGGLSLKFGKEMISSDVAWLTIGMLGVLASLKAVQELENLKARTPFVQVEAVALKVVGVKNEALAIGLARAFYYVGMYGGAMLGLMANHDYNQVIWLSLGQALNWGTEAGVDFYLRRKYKRD